MENSRDENLRTVLIQLKVALLDVDLLRNNSIDHCDELDAIKENIDRAFFSISEILNGDLKRRD